MKREPPLPGILGRGAAWVYSKGIGFRNQRFDNRKGVVEFDRPCISVGNLSTGGTGKTPVVKWLIAKLREAGHDPCIAMRGYKAVNGVSDEAQEYAQRWPDLPLVVKADRMRGLIEMFGTERGAKVDSIVLDDGFQHRQIFRQCDIVVIDATRSPFEDALLPAGHLREPVESLKRADVCIVTRTDIAGSAATSQLVGQISNIHTCPIMVTRHQWGSVRVIENGAARNEPVDVLKGKRLVACAGIGNPSAFFEQVKRAGVQVSGTLALPDHDPFVRGTVDRLLELARGSEGVILTEKDWVKAQRWGSVIAGLAVYCPSVEIAVVEGEAVGWQRICQVFDRATTDETC